MARERIVSRTIKGFVYTVKAYQESTDSVVVESITIMGDEPENKRLKALKAKLESKGLVLIKIDVVNDFERQFFMPEEEFIRLARPM